MSWEFPSPSITLPDLKNELAGVCDDTTLEEFELGRSVYNSRNNTLTYGDSGSNSLTLEKTSFRQLCDLIDVPAKYAERMPDTLTDYTVNYLLENGPRRPYNALVGADGHVRSLMRPDLPYVRHDDLLEAIVNTFEGEAPYVHKWNSYGGKLSVQLRSPELTFTDPGGSVLFGGLHFTYDDSWKSAPLFKTFLNRLVCDNGASVNVEARKFRVDGYTTQGVLEQASVFASLALQQVNQMVDGLMAMQNEKIKNAEGAIKNICMQHKIPQKIQQLLLRYLTDAGYLSTVSGSAPETMYDIINLFTYVGTHDFSISQEYRDLLCEIGGGAMFKHDPTCTECGSTI